MDLYKTGMLVAMFLCVRGIDLCIYGPVQDRNASGHRSLYLLCVVRGSGGSIFVFMDLYKTGMLVAMFLCVRGIDCIYEPVQDRNVSGHVFVCQGDRLYLWTCTRQEC